MEVLNVDKYIVVDFEEILWALKVADKIFHGEGNLDGEIQIGIDKIFDDDVVEGHGFKLNSSHGRIIADRDEK